MGENTCTQDIIPNEMQRHVDLIILVFCQTVKSNHIKNIVFEEKMMEFQTFLVQKSFSEEISEIFS